MPTKYKNHKERLEISMSSSKICHWQNETLHETVIIWNCTSMSSFKPLPLQLESGFSPLPVPQSLPCSPFFTTKWSALDWGDKFKDELQENKGKTRNKTRKQQQQQQQQLGPGLPPDPSLLLRHPKCYAAASDLQARLTGLKKSLTTESINDLITGLSFRDASVSEDILSLPSL